MNIHHITSSSLIPKFSPANDFSSGFYPTKAKDKWACTRVGVQCTAISGSETKANLQAELPAVINWQEILEDHKAENVKISSSAKITTCIKSIRAIFANMDDGEINVSPYDTAWVALVEDMNKTGFPQFPSSLQWIVDNQLSDGSWGDDKLFLAHDRILNTLASVIALRSWNVHPEKIERGTKIKMIVIYQRKLSKLGDEHMEHMPIGFEVAFPSLVELAATLNIEVPMDLHILQEIYAHRDLKLSKIPKDIMHKVPTPLLYSLEGMTEMDWEQLLELQSEDGSFLFSPSSTAYALMQTRDDKCLNYLNKVVNKFNGGVPAVYPVDLFEHAWVVDRLERLGISRYFKSEIKECMDYISRYWKNDGICWARNSRVNDIDDTAMAFRLLRLHGYSVSQDVFRNFESNGEFFSFIGQSNEAVTGMFDLLRTSQVLFPEEKLLEDAKRFSFEFLRRKQAKNQLVDKWIIAKDLPGEVGYALDIPWYASLPRLETSFYLDQYGGEEDVWIGKTLYRLDNVNNNTYLELAKLDYAKCQRICRLEWDCMKEWCSNSKLEEFGMTEKSLLLSYYLAASSLFEPELSNSRLAWAKTEVLVETIRSYFGNIENSAQQRKAFVQEFKKISEHLNYVDHGRYKLVGKDRKQILGPILGMLKQLTLDALITHGIYIQQQLHQSWIMWLVTWQEKGDVDKTKAQLLEQTINICAGRWTSDKLLTHSQYQSLSDINNQLCHQLGHFRYQMIHNEDGQNTNRDGITTTEIESNMRELVQIVFSNSPDSLDAEFKQTFFMVTRTFYYTAYCNPMTIDSHINKVLFGHRI